MPGMKTLTGMTGTGSAVELAEMLRQMGRGRDTVLAHITPEEAQMLMDQGGSGTTNPATGLPEFEIQDFDFNQEVMRQQAEDPFYQEPDYEAPLAGGFSLAEQAPADFTDMTGFRQPSFIGGPEMPPGTRFDMAVPPVTQPIDITSPMYRQPFSPFERAALPEQPAAPGFLERGAQTVEDTATKARELATRYPTVARLLSTGATSLPALLNASRARREADRRAEELRRLGAPLREQGEALRQRALAGQLTPQQAAAQEAERARQRQAAASRGVTAGTQAQMIENQLARQRAQLSETNLNNAIKLLNLGNAYDEEAIRMKIAGDQRVSNTLANIFANLGQQAAATQTQPQSPQGQETRVTRRPDVRQA